MEIFPYGHQNYSRYFKGVLSLTLPKNNVLEFKDKEEGTYYDYILKGIYRTSTFQTMFF